MFRDMSPQFIEGTFAWAEEKPRSSNPYSPTKQPAFYGRWDNGWTECDRVTEDAQETLNDDFLLSTGFE